METLTLVINLSLRSIRVLLFEEGGKKLYEDWLPVRTYIDGDFVEQDANEWWELFLELLKKVSENSILREGIKYITVTSSALCLVTIGDNDKVLDKVIMVSDKRAQNEASIIREKFSDIFKKNRSFKADPSYMLPKIMWLKRNKQNVFTNAKKFLSANDFFVYRLTGVIKTDELNAEKFYYSPEEKKYKNEILDFIGLDEKKLPTVVLPATEVGKVKEEIKHMLGISHDVSVMLSTYDAICALIGSSTHEDGELNNVCGTCSSYRFFSKKNVNVLESSLILQQLSGEGLYIVGGSNNLEGGILEWAKECFYGDSYLKDDSFLYDLIQKEAQESELGANGIIFLPHLLGERMPFSDPDVRGIFFGIERFHSRKDIIRSVFEAMCFQAKLIIEEFERKDLHILSINMSGGLAKIPLAAQLRADILGMPVNVLEEIETTALGAYILSLKSRGKIPSIKQTKNIIKIEKTYLPNMHNHNCYSSLFLLYKQLYNSSKEMFRQRREIRDNIMHYRKKVLEAL